MAKTELFNFYAGISNTKVSKWFNKVNNLGLISNFSFSRKKVSFYSRMSFPFRFIQIKNN